MQRFFTYYTLRVRTALTDDTLNFIFKGMYVINYIYDYGGREIVPAWHSRQSVWTRETSKLRTFSVCGVVRNRLSELVEAL
jgi:hypothetical protein